MATRRLPLSAVVASTALALAAALAVFALADNDEAGRGDASGGSAAADTGSYQLSPQGDPAESVAEIRFEQLGDTPSAALGDLLTGRPMVVNFFASWCGPCVDEMPAIERVHQSLGDQVSFVGLALQDDDEAALATVAATGVTYPTYADPGGDALTYFRGTIMPTTVFLAPDGTVVDVSHGELDEAQLRARIEERFGVGS